MNVTSQAAKVIRNQVAASRVAANRAAAKKAVAAVEDFRQGYLDGEQESGDGDDTNPGSDNLDSSNKEDKDA